MHSYNLEDKDYGQQRLLKQTYSKQTYAHTVCAFASVHECICRVLIMDHADSLLTGLTLEDKSPVCWQAQSSAGTTAREGGHFLRTSCST